MLNITADRSGHDCQRVGKLTVAYVAHGGGHSGWRYRQSAGTATDLPQRINRSDTPGKMFALPLAGESRLAGHGAAARGDLLSGRKVTGSKSTRCSERRQAE